MSFICSRRFCKKELNCYDEFSFFHRVLDELFKLRMPSKVFEIFTKVEAVQSHEVANHALSFPDKKIWKDIPKMFDLITFSGSIYCTKESLQFLALCETIFETNAILPNFFCRKCHDFFKNKRSACGYSAGGGGDLGCSQLVIYLVLLRSPEREPNAQTHCALLLIGFTTYGRHLRGILSNLEPIFC